ncbi:hypothetical protein SARC_12383, partial [Sphaeroforma arctica JP610]
MEVLKAIKEITDNLNGKIDDLPEYFNKRVGVWEKVTPKTDRTIKESKTTTDEDKDGTKEHKNVSTKLEESTSSTPFINPDCYQALLAIDVKFYVQLHRLLQQAYDAAIISANTIARNHDKLTNPKGSGGGAHHMF